MTAPTRTDPAPREDHRHGPHDPPSALAGLARIPVQVAEPIRCRRCHSPAPERLFRVVGTWSVIDGDAAWDCDGCTRENLFEIESGSASAQQLTRQLRRVDGQG